MKIDSDPEVRTDLWRWLPCRGAEASWLTSLLCSCRGHRCSSVVVDVAVLPQRQVPAVGLDSWDEV